MIKKTQVDSRSMFGYNNFEVCDLEELENMESRRKELLVKKVHPYTITEPTDKYKLYRTRIKSDRVPNGRLTSTTYKGLINLLYEHYYGDTDKISLEDCALKWIEKRESNGTIEYLTALHYRNDFMKYFHPEPISSMPIRNITKRHLINAFESIIGSGQGVSRKAINNVKTVINGAFDYANLIDGMDCIDARLIRITDLVRKCERPDNEDLVYTREEAEQIIAYLLSKPFNIYSLAIMLMFCLPVRISELRALKWVDYDKKKNQLYLNHTIVTKKVGSINRKDTDVNYMKAHSSAGKRYVDVSDFAAYILEEIHKINGNKVYILQSNGDMPISTNHFNEHLKLYCKDLNIQYKSSHKIRFYACSMMYEAGFDEKTIQKCMGHTSVAMTRHYDRRKKKITDRDLINSTFGYNLLGDGTKNNDKTL